MSGKRKYSCNYRYFEKIDSKEKAYWLGFILADGCVMHTTRIRKLKTCESKQDRYLTQLSLSIKDYDHLEKLNHALESTYPINVYATNSKHDYGRILIEDKDMFDDLIHNGLEERKTLNEKFPYHIKKKYHMDILRGIFDADGCISKHKTKYGTDEYEITLTATKEIIYAFMDILGIDKNIKLHQRRPDPNKNNYTLKKTGNLQCYKYLTKLYENSNIYLTRKYKKYLQLKEFVEGRS